MEVKKVIKLKSKFPQCDLTTGTENFFIKVGDQYILVHNSPALFCYHTYPGYPDNGIALKGFVNGPQNVMTSKEEIDQKYGDRDTMKQMLYYGLELAKCIPDGECWQGDCLFTSDSKKEENILGKDYITFQPNKIIYAFSEDQPGYEEVKNAVFGICFHTIYSGENKSQTFKCDPTRLKNVPSNFYIMSPALNVDKESFNVDQIKAHIAKLSRLESQLLSNEGYKTLVFNSKFMKDYWSTFENKVLADRQQTTINETTFINELKDYISEKLGKDIDKLKTDKSKVKAQQKLADLLDLVENNKQVLTLLVKTLNEAANIKMLLWEGFRQAKSDYSTFYKSKTKGHFGADMEGIAVSDQDGNIVKIVDRSKFSSYNRDPDIESGWEHNESLSEDIDKFYRLEINGEGAYSFLRKLYRDSYDIYRETGNYEAVENARKLYNLIAKIMDNKEMRLRTPGEFFKNSKFAFTPRAWSLVKTQTYRGKPILDVLKNELKKNNLNLEVKEINPKLLHYNDDWQVQYESLSEAVIRRDFNKLIEEEEEVDPSKTLVFSFGKFNPPTIGHVMLMKTMANCNETSNKPVVYLSHRYGFDKKDITKSQPLNYEEKFYWCNKAFSQYVDVVKSNAITAWEALHEIQQKYPHITRIIFAGGDDRAEGSMYKNLVASNNSKISKEKDFYNFPDGIIPLVAGEKRDETSTDLITQASSTLVKKCVLENDFNKFQKLVPFNETDAEDLFDEIKDFYGRLNEGMLIEAPVLSKKKYVSDPEIEKNLETELNKIDPKLDAPNPNMDIDSYRLHPDEYTGLFVKQGTRDNVSFSKPDVEARDGSDVVQKLTNMTFDDSTGKEYRLYPSGSKMGKGAIFNSKVATYYQEAIQMLLLTKKLRFNGDLIDYLQKSDPEGNKGVFDQINVLPYKDISIFRQCWQQFLNSWKKSFIVDNEESNIFISEVNNVFNNVNNLVPLHDGIKSKYSQIAGSVLTQQKDFIDKSDGYVFNGNYISELENIFSTMATLLRNKKAAEYVKFIQQNSNKIIGVSLKQNNGKNLLLDPYNIERDDNVFTGTFTLMSTGSGKSWGIRFDTDNKFIGLDIRPAGDAANKVEFRVPGSPANGNAIKALQYVFGDEYKQFGEYLKNKDFGSAAKWLCSKLADDDTIEINKQYKMSEKGLNLITRIFNLASGFSAKDADGNRITAPYIKVH